MVKSIKYGVIPRPQAWIPSGPVALTDATMQARKENVLRRMKEKNLDVLCIYADREHGGNFGYLTGFEPRFEEAMLILHNDGSAFLMLGNESLRMGQYSRLQNTVVHVPYFSLPNQPMGNAHTFIHMLREAGLCGGMSAGIVGWKMFTSDLDDNTQIYEVPHFIVHAISEAVGNGGTSGNGKTINAADIFLCPESGLRTISNANEIAHFEYGATLASNCILRAMDAIEIGKTEMDIADYLAAKGQPITVQTICATGERFTNAEVAPRNKAISLGDTFSLTMGLRGGLTSRAGYIARTEADLPEQAGDYLDALAKPYYAAAVKWYETIAIGLSGGKMYKTIQDVLPQLEYGWKLNPGHLLSSEEWLSSPIYPDSQMKIRSGMLFQMDIIPKKAGYGGSNAEDGIAVADAQLREALKLEYPAVYERMMHRRRYMTEVLGIQLHDEILPMSNTSGYLRPLLLEMDKAFYKATND